MIEALRSLDASDVIDIPALLLTKISVEQKHAPDGTTLSVFADDEGSLLAVNAETDAVLSVSKDTHATLRSVNTDLAAFVKFQTLYLDHQGALQDEDDDVAVAAVEKIRSEMRKIDATAMADPEAWWPMILEQIEEGNL